MFTSFIFHKTIPTSEFGLLHSFTVNLYHENQVVTKVVIGIARIDRIT